MGPDPLRRQWESPEENSPLGPPPTIRGDALPSDSDALSFCFSRPQFSSPHSSGCPHSQIQRICIQILSTKKRNKSAHGNVSADVLFELRNHNVVASFYLQKPVSWLEDNILLLSDDIIEEIGVPSTKVVILSLDPLPRANKTKVVFAVDPYSKYSELSAAAISLIRASFKYLVIRQSYLQLTTFLFGVPSIFESKVQLEFRCYVKSVNTAMNLYVILSNAEGSTVAAPTIVQSSVVLAVGITPSKERLKELAQTIMGDHSWNLGLNNTQFGRVKQVRLSSILQHFLHGSGSASSPSPAPLSHPHHHHRHHHHHHHHHSHHYNAHKFPETSPAPAPTTGEGVASPKFGSPVPARSVPSPGGSSYAHPPNCRFGHRKRSPQNTQKHAHLTPAVAPTNAPHYPVTSPQVGPPAHGFHSSFPALSPLPNVAFAHAELPPKNEPSAESPNSHFVGPSPSSSSAGCVRTLKWTWFMFLVLVLLLKMLAKLYKKRSSRDAMDHIYVAM
ncbi:hypothetical protein VNO78_21497 [Psophocarpus tetragonolobus]|uniref:DUF7036 domain-containing protein n=1 Tax=Psophocarpus tetragonolobus TaxID=3891 RepID=A0AAN9SCF7_PSOTE